ncbi:MAG: transketolase [Gemmatimonadetes bacterium]|nr:transketolase [Gemmatimonadota bacterium]
MPSAAEPAGFEPTAWTAINTIRTLAMDAVEQANSGHPGTPMALAPVAYVLWTRHLRHDPRTPDWSDRDRFVLSCGHASMLLYSILHLTGYDVSLDDIVNFRQWGSATPGHPERGHTPGVETTTGPLGQGVGNAVGMAMAERYLAERFNRPGHQVVDHRVWALVSDGDLMEGVASEAASLAGHLRLGKLTLIYDDNRITIDGTTELSFSEDVGRRFEAYGWRVTRVDDGNDLAAIDAALHDAGNQSDRPSLVILRTVIGDPAPKKRNTPEAHGAPLGKDEVERTKALLEWPRDPFHVPDAAREDMGRCLARGEALHRAWLDTKAAHETAHSDLAAEFGRWLSDTIPVDWDQVLPAFGPTDSLATRQASGTVLNALARAYPSLIGGSADLAGSTGVAIKGATTFSGAGSGQSVAWGIREHAMAAAMNGMAAHGGVRPFGSTFLVFADYMKPSIRLAALMHLPVIYVFTHDSIGVGEDGPTHQPIEHLAMLRGIPNMVVIRPGSPAETAQAWRAALERHDGPTALILTRQKLPPVDHSRHSAAGLLRGGYVVFEPAGPPEALVLANGSELAVAIAAATRLSDSGLPTRVVSLSSWERFRSQPPSYRDAILPPALRARVSIEAAATFGWQAWLTDRGEAIGIDHFGASAPGDRLFAEFGITAEHVVDAVRRVHQRSD